MVSRVASRLPFRAQRSIDVREHFTGKYLQAAVSGTSVSSSSAGESKMVFEAIVSLSPELWCSELCQAAPPKSGGLYMSGAIRYI
jgi:hypothetical protein